MLSTLFFTLSKFPACCKYWFLVGDDVEITYRLSGRKWQRDANSEVKFFLNAEATSFKVLSGGGSGASVPAADFDPNSGLAEAAVDEEDIPF